MNKPFISSTFDGASEDAERKSFRAHMARLRNKAALWDELRVLAIKRGVITPDTPHRVLRARLMAAVEAQDNAG